MEVVAGTGFFADVGPEVQGTGADFENAVAGQSEVSNVGKVEGVAEFVLAFERVFEFAFGIGLGAESDVVNTAVTVDKNEVAFVGVHETTAVGELGFEVFVFGIPHILPLWVVDTLRSDLEWPGVTFGPRVGFAFAHEIESKAQEYIHVAPFEDSGNQIGANMDDSQILELDLSAVDTVRTQDTPAAQRFGFAMSFRVSSAVALPDFGNYLPGKMCNGLALGMRLELDSKSKRNSGKCGLDAGLPTEKTENVGHQAGPQMDPEPAVSKDWSGSAEPSAVPMLESGALTGRRPENEYLMLNELEAG